MQKHRGFIADTIKPEDYFLGSEQVPQTVLQKDGQWHDYLPKFENQSTQHLETSNCTAFGSTNLVEILMKRLFGVEYNFSERYVGILAGTTKVGNSPHTVLETIRHEGLIDDSLLPFSDDIQTWEQYYSPKPMLGSFLKTGRDWLRQYDFKHEWAFLPTTHPLQKPNLIKEALKYSPVGVSVYAWRFKTINGEKIYSKDASVNDNHWCIIFGYEEGKHWLVYDHYESAVKKLAWDYNFQFAKRIYIAKNPPKESFWSILLRIIRSIIKK